MRRLFSQLSASSSAIKIAAGAVVGVWSLVLVALLVVLAVLSGCSVAAQPPATTMPSVPGIALDPTVGPAGSPVTVRGEGWTPGGMVMIYLAAPGQTEPPSFAASGTTVDAEGRFTTTVILPVDPAWQVQGLATIIARAGEGGASAQAVYGVIGASESPTATPVEPTATPTIVVQPTEAASPTPAATPEPGAPTATANTDLNIRSGPGTTYPVLGLLRSGQSAEITGISPDGGWWQIRFSGAAGERGWVSRSYVTAQNTGDVPLVQPPAAPPTVTPTPTATPVVITDWRGEYYGNPNLGGSPALVRNDAAVNFDWGSGSPSPGLPADGFSVRWTRNFNFSAGTYRFYARVDDGVRLWVDGSLVIDQWHDGAPTLYSADVRLGDGSRSIRMEYYERSGGALAQLAWERVENYPDWKGEYFDNRHLDGNPVLVRNDGSINFDWGNGSPGSGVPSDNFSVRWTRNLNFSAGTYRFYARVDDGVRLWVDGKLIIDEWRDGSATTYTGDITLAGGSRSIRMEYYERSGGALAQLAWERVENYPDWKGEYFDNRRLDGDPVLVRNDGSIDFNWGNGSPGSGVPSDNFSARWTRKVDFRSGTYRFSVRVDDGARLWVDDKLVIDGWEDGSPRLLEAEHKINEGTHRIKVEYYERGGGAQIKVSWQRQDQTNRPPQSVPGGPYVVDEGSQVTFDGRASSDPDGRIDSYEWDFNYDGNTFDVDGTGDTVSTRYPDGPATITIALRVTDDRGAKHVATAQVTVNNVPPTAQAGGPYAGQVGAPITLTGAASDPGRRDERDLVFAWDFGDGSSGDGPVVSHTYAQPGSYRARLTVTDKDGASDRAGASVEITAASQPPTAVISGPSAGLVGEALTFSAAGSSDPDGQIVDYTWDLGDGMAAGGSDVAHSYTAPGTYQVTLAVTDNQGLKGWATKAVKIKLPAPANRPPTAVISGPTSGMVGNDLSFSAAGSSDPDGQIVSYTWDFGDGATATGQDVSHSYADIGDYQVTLTVTDDGGLTGQAGQTVKIDQIIQINLPPTAVISAPATAVVGEPVQFDGTGSSDSDGQIVRYVWDFGDGAKERGPVVTHVYDQKGKYQVRLVVIDNGDVRNDTSHVLKVVQSAIGDAPRAAGEQP